MQTILERFLSKVNKQDGGCWIWNAARFDNGYGCFKLKGKMHRSHRMSWTLYHGEIPDGMFVCHRCDVKACVNPDHLFLGTNSDNLLDAKHKGRLPDKSGENNMVAKLTDESVRDIRLRFDGRKTTKTALARQYGVHEATINRVLTRKIWGHVQ